MKISKRLQNLPDQFFSSLVEKVGKKVATGHDVINLGQGNPDQPTPAHIVEALKTASEKPGNHKYSLFRGKHELKKAAADFYAREYDVTIDPATEVAILFGTKTGLVELPMCIMDPGDVMLLPDPGYPDYLSGVVLGEVQFETMPLIAENNFLPDFTKIPTDVAEKAELMYLNYPNNPTGAIATADFFEETVAFAKENNITVAHDFAYGGIGFDGKKPISFLQTPGAKEVGIELYTLSKTYNMAGWRVGFAVGNKNVIEAINLIQDHMYVSLFPGIQDAAIEALTGDQTCVNELNNRYEKRRNAFIIACERIGWEAVAPAGSFFAWMPVPEGFTSSRFADYLLEEVNVAVADGSGFGEFGEGYVRVGLLMEEARLEEAVARISKLHLFDKVPQS
ncbi:pyridoxal phosphate-dependent aminotransferase [Listeria ivanovii]|uniref:Pyridoxal phosphate-dependent aminotransferase n=2 Tax=Listeria ivanovii TaxID=1638 RepID=A0ABS1G584_LISIV|nr:pyridoxal phosphate-dependent aminotransferase [Listeria ivanovii]EFR98267.1 transaminase MtnE [Listeria ivanovii FSL F6-596]AIS58749.1 aspartate aminotransferase [Listeria ivanovii subsp. londoniensis]AIS61555.1 aspartate aminotransferase [Listeria ivanovii subsp. londoniensis]MBK1962031.1 pyridoxal phosphate-dependent aminotransferase [Listeria ivanovii subsp. londoniensis]MBK1966018.1 pyridoxal phosphate-dependent aminotransferase [Listeria ivanovii subsp. londoniensis]